MQLKVNESVYYSPKCAAPVNGEERAKRLAEHLASTDSQSQGGVSFKGGKIALSQKARLWFRQLSNYMKEPSEMTNAEIAAIGTGGIAPFAILCSPGKKPRDEEDKKASKDKKIFQALRQPVSAALAFFFQVPTTIGIAKLLNYRAYVKKDEVFNDEVLGSIIPEEKYLKKKALQYLKDSSNEPLAAEWRDFKPEFNDELRNKFLDSLRKDYEQVGIDLSREELEKMAQNESKRQEFLAKEMASARRKSLIAAKAQELTGNPNIKFEDIDLVTGKYQDLAKEWNKEEFKALRKDLKWYDKILEYIGINNGNLDRLEKAEKALAKEKGLEIMREKEPDLFNNPAEKLKRYVEARSSEADKLFKNKIFWITLGLNLGMVAISCMALNWLHPKFATTVEAIKQWFQDKKSPQEQKPEVVS